MDTRARQLVGWAMVVAGLVVAAVGLFAEQIGLTEGENTELGTKQILVIVAGAVIAVIGLVVALVLKGKEPAT